MARNALFTKRLWQFEILERRNMMAADFDLAVCPLPTSPMPDVQFVAVANGTPDPMMVWINEHITQMQQDAPTQVASPEPTLYQSDVTSSDAFTAQVNEAIVRMGIERPESQAAFTAALQTAMSDNGPLLLDSEAELEDLFNQFITADSTFQFDTTTDPNATQTRSSSPTDWSAPATIEKNFEGINVQLLRTVRNDHWVVGVTSRLSIVFREIDGQTWHLLNQFSEDRTMAEFFPSNDELIIRYDVPTENFYENQLKEMVVNMRTGEVETIRELEPVAWPSINVVGAKWQLSTIPFGLYAIPLEAPESQALDFLPSDLTIVRAEFTASPDIALIHGLSREKPLEYRTLTVDLLNRRIISDEVTDQEGAGFLAKRAGDTFNILWQMETNDLFDPETPGPNRRRTPDLPYGYFELPNLMFKLPGMKFGNTHNEDVSLEWSVESISILEFPTPGPNGRPLDFTVTALIQVPGGKPLHQTYRATISEYDEALASLKDIGMFLESRGESLAEYGAAETGSRPDQPSQPTSEPVDISSTNQVDVNTIPGGLGQLGYIETILREIDLRLKKTQMQLSVTKI